MENKMENIKINISELFLLNNFFGSQIPKKVIDEYFTKKNHRSKAKDYKEGSPNYIAEIAKDAEIALLSDYNIKNDFVELTIELDYSRKVTFNILTYTYTKLKYEPDREEYYEVELTANFLCKNTSCPTDIVISINELLVHDDIRTLLFLHQKEKLKLDIYNELKSLGKCFSFLLKEIVLQAHLEFKPVKYYSQYSVNYTPMGKCVVIGDKNEETIYSEIELRKIYQDFKNNVKFYDKEDRVIEYNSGSYLAFHKEHSLKTA